MSIYSGDRQPVYIENTYAVEGTVYATQLRFRLFLSATLPSLTSIPSVNSQKDTTFRLLLYTNISSPPRYIQMRDRTRDIRHGSSKSGV